MFWGVFWLLLDDFRMVFWNKNLVFCPVFWIKVKNPWLRPAPSPEWHFKQGALKTFFVKSDSVCDLSCVFAIELQKQRLK